jgi:hypothetical protein
MPADGLKISEKLCLIYKTVSKQVKLGESATQLLVPKC